MAGDRDILSRPIRDGLDQCAGIRQWDGMVLGFGDVGCVRRVRRFTRRIEWVVCSPDETYKQLEAIFESNRRHEYMEPNGILAVILWLGLYFATKIGFIGMATLIYHAKSNFIEGANEHYKKSPNVLMVLAGLANGFIIPFIAIIFLNIPVLVLFGFALLIFYLVRSPIICRFCDFSRGGPHFLLGSIPKNM